MINLREETINAMKEIGKSIDDIDYSYIFNGSFYNIDKVFCKGDIDLKSIDIMYDDGYGGQEIHGFIVFKDGTWLERREYDGSEWWEFFSKPHLG